jgi:hypothetical protein
MSWMGRWSMRKAIRKAGAKLPANPTPASHVSHNEHMGKLAEIKAKNKADKYGGWVTTEDRQAMHIQGIPMLAPAEGYVHTTCLICPRCAGPHRDSLPMSDGYVCLSCGKPYPIPIYGVVLQHKPDPLNSSDRTYIQNRDGVWKGKGG